MYRYNGYIWFTVNWLLVKVSLDMMLLHWDATVVITADERFFYLLPVMKSWGVQKMHHVFCRHRVIILIYDHDLWGINLFEYVIELYLVFVIKQWLLVYVPTGKKTTGMQIYHDLLGIPGELCAVYLSRCKEDAAV